MTVEQIVVQLSFQKYEIKENKKLRYREEHSASVMRSWCTENIC